MALLNMPDHSFGKGVQNPTHLVRGGPSVAEGQMILKR